MKLENLTMKHDYIFKLIFGTEKNKDILKDFLEAILKKKIESIEVTNNASLEKEDIEYKLGVLDIKAVVDGKVVNIEMQVKNEHNMEQRVTFYAASLVRSSLKEGDSYSKLPKIISINILDFNYIGNDNFINKTVTVINDEARDYVINNNIEYCYIELPKLRKYVNETKNVGRLEKWLMVIDGMSVERIDDFMRENKYMKKAQSELEDLKSDILIKEIAFAKEKSRRDYIDAMEIYQLKGLNKGLNKGLKQGVQL